MTCIEWTCTKCTLHEINRALADSALELLIGLLKIVGDWHWTLIQVEDMASVVYGLMVLF